MLKNEIEAEKEKEKQMLTEINTFKSLMKSREDGNYPADFKVYFSKMIKNLSIATSVISFNNVKIKEMERELDTINTKYNDKCNQIKLLAENYEKLKGRFKEEGLYY